nr:MAG TPA: TMEM156 protein family protein [Caudoviricetes sp.]
MKKIENKSLMMILGIIICWITGAAICGIVYLLIKYLSFKIFFYITIPFIIGFLVYMIIYKVRE